MISTSYHRPLFRRGAASIATFSLSSVPSRWISGVCDDGIKVTDRTNSDVVAAKKRRRKQPVYRIVSLCPSTTLTLFDLGLGDYIVGRTQFCIGLPDNYEDVIPTYGGTKNPKWKHIADEAKPTHILFNMEENNYKHLSKAQEICETLIDTPISIEGSKEMVLHLGETFDCSDKAHKIAQEIDDLLLQVQTAVAVQNNYFTYLYFVWHGTRQRRVVGEGTYIGKMLEAAGGTNLAITSGLIHESDSTRYPLLPEGYTQQADKCLLSTEPFEFTEDHIREYKKFARDETRVIDGEMLSWHGSRTIQGLQYLMDYFTLKQGDGTETL